MLEMLFEFDVSCLCFFQKWGKCMSHRKKCCCFTLDMDFCRDSRMKYDQQEILWRQPNSKDLNLPHPPWILRNTLQTNKTTSITQKLQRADVLVGLKEQKQKNMIFRLVFFVPFPSREPDVSLNFELDVSLEPPFKDPPFAGLVVSSSFFAAWSCNFMKSLWSTWRPRKPPFGMLLKPVGKIMGEITNLNRWSKRISNEPSTVSS